MNQPDCPRCKSKTPFVRAIMSDNQVCAICSYELTNHWFSILCIDQVLAVKAQQ